jgi:proteasome lid subunit RPN8/RPN11
MTELNKQKFLNHALENMPRESCALLIDRGGKEDIILCKNISVPNDQFILDPKCYLFASLEGEIIAVIHSHCFAPPIPSSADKISCEESNLPWHICSVPNGTWGSFQPSGYKAPLIGREFSHGILDCYSLIRDYFKETLSIEIPDFQRDYEWWSHGLDLYKENFEKAGFFEIEHRDLKEHDCILMQIHSKVMNHAAVYLGKDVMLHHLTGRLSRREIFGGYYKKHSGKYLRHRDV